MCNEQYVLQEASLFCKRWIYVSGKEIVCHGKLNCTVGPYVCQMQIWLS